MNNGNVQKGPGISYLFRPRSSAVRPVREAKADIGPPRRFPSNERSTRAPLRAAICEGIPPESPRPSSVREVSTESADHCGGMLPERPEAPLSQTSRRLVREDHAGGRPPEKDVCRKGRIVNTG